MAKIDRFPLYVFRSDGSVVSHVRKNPIVLKPIKMGNYVGLQLKRKDGAFEKAYLHRLICEAFHGPSAAGQECMHLDSNKANNAAENLRWGTAKENNSHKAAHGTIGCGEKNPMAKLTAKKVQEMISERESTGISYAQIAKKNNISTMTAYRAITGQSWRE